ncbi:MAG: GNAT family N-acetyltransferase [Candidatus Sericytochromatia bacterium]
MRPTGHSLALDPVRRGEAAWRHVEALLADADPVLDLLLWADVASGLARLSRVWLAREGDRPVGVAYAFPLWPDQPSLGLKGETPAIERAMAAALVGSGAWTRGFVITDPAQVPIFEAVGTVADRFEEIHMGLDSATWQPVPAPPGTRPGRLDELDAFYRAQGAGAWNPAQFETGPYVVSVEGDRVVAAAGTHFAYPGLAQLGNVFTAPAHRGRGHAERVTQAVTQALVAAGYPTVSLFVAADNASARRLYARLGYRELRSLAAFGWQAPQ